MDRIIKAIFFDIDGTLRDFATGRIPASAKEGLLLARDAGIKIFIATGRHKLEIEEEDLLEGIEFDGYVTLNGQYCYTSSQAVFKHPIAPADVEKMAALIDQYQFPCLFMEAERMYINMVNDFVIQAQQMIRTAIPPVKDISSASFRDIYQMVPYVNREMEAVILKELSSCAATRWSAEFAFDLTPLKGDKCLGIEKMAEYHGIDIAQTAAVGDGYNDVSMLQHAGAGVAMGNGCAAAKAAAGHVTEDISQDGLLHAVRYLLNL